MGGFEGRNERDKFCNYTVMSKIKEIIKIVNSQSPIEN